MAGYYYEAKSLRGWSPVKNRLAPNSKKAEGGYVCRTFRNKIELTDEEWEMDLYVLQEKYGSSQDPQGPDGSGPDPHGSPDVPTLRDTPPSPVPLEGGAEAEPEQGDTDEVRPTFRTTRI